MNIFQKIFGAIFNMVDSESYDALEAQYKQEVNANKMLEEKLSAANTTLAENTESIKKLNSQVEILQQSKEQLTQYNEEYKAKITDLEGQLTNANVKIETLTKTNADLSTENTNLKAKVFDLQEQIDKYESENADIVALQAKVDSLTQTVNELQTKNNEISAENADLLKQVDDLTTDLNTADTTIDTLKKVNDSLTAEIESVKETSYGYQTENETLKAKIAELEAKIKELQDQITKLEEELTKPDEPEKPEVEMLSVSVKDTDDSKIKVHVNDQIVPNNSAVDLPKGSKVTIYAEAVNPEDQDNVVLNVSEVK